MRFSWIGAFTILLLSACQQKKDMQQADKQADTMTVDTTASTSTQQVESFSTVTKGKTCLPLRRQANMSRRASS